MADNKDSRLERYKRDISKDADPMIEQMDLANEDMRFVNVSGGRAGVLIAGGCDRTKL